MRFPSRSTASAGVSLSAARTQTPPPGVLAEAQQYGLAQGSHMQML